jgi:hypothetical protein
MAGLERYCLLGLMIVLFGGVAAQQERREVPGEAPDLALLEYLGSWRGDDEAWFVDAEIEAEHEDKPRRDERRDEERNE